MKISILKKETGLYVEYKDGDYTTLWGRDTALNFNGDEAVIFIDLSSNARVRNKESHRHSDGVDFLKKGSSLSYIQFFELDAADEMIRLIKSKANGLPIRLHIKASSSITFKFDVRLARYEGFLQIEVEYFTPE